MLSTKRKIYTKGRSKKREKSKNPWFWQVKERMSVGEQGRSPELPHLGMIHVVWGSQTLGSLYCDSCLVREH